ncbi:class I SAM-dependent rRNA methyltransferase [Flavobacteriaceae bacterium TK19130]|nr:class I SAM-dependent rRNA methyltransferase [Thermobacterium salinum]
MFQLELPDRKPKTLAVKLSARAEKMVKKGHPWIFSNSIEKLNKEGMPGDIAVIYERKRNEVIGVGLYDPDSPITIKMLYHGKGKKIDADFFLDRIQRAKAKRSELLETDTNAYRLLFGENDGFPGLIADIYVDVAVVKLYSQVWLPYMETILKQLIDVSEVETLVIRLSRKLQEVPLFPISDGQVVFGDLSDETIQFQEHGVNFSANLLKGHKTGYFLDHRHNRHKVGQLAEGKTVLDVFAYAGGFSVHALANGASEVTSVDISHHALEVAKQNVALNETSGVHKTVEGDAFHVLQQFIRDEVTFDFVVIDPPSFAKSQKEIMVAKKKYGQLAALGSRLVAEKGMLVLASCSSRVTAEQFFEVNAENLSKSGRSFERVDETFHDSDHPISFQEGAYLKCGYYKFLD